MPLHRKPCHFGDFSAASDDCGHVVDALVLNKGAVHVEARHPEVPKRETGRKRDEVDAAFERASAELLREALGWDVRQTDEVGTTKDIFGGELGGELFEFRGIGPAEEDVDAFACLGDAGFLGFVGGHSGSFPLGRVSTRNSSEHARQRCPVRTVPG